MLMPITAATKAQRGTKRTCQNAECGSRFYDLNHDPIICPICNTAYALALAPPPPPAGTSIRPYRKPTKKPGIEAADGIKAEVGAEDDELAVIETEEEPAVAEDDETIIEEVEEDASDVSGMIDASIDTDEKA
jgi:uncharacterized protein (TIGR02300 family)